MSKDPKGKGSEGGREKQGREPEASTPAGFLSRFRAEFDRFFEDVSGELIKGRRPGEKADSLSFPAVEILTRKNELVVRADLPGLTKEDLKVEVTDGVLTIQGERRQQEAKDEGNIFRSERSYGSFFRSIPLPAGADVESATASFRNGVLEVVMKTAPAPPPPGRRIDIQ
jgi:HSP20 family protein